MPRVSVLLPVYNGAKYIREAVDSILAQSFEDFELLVIDDGSRDESAGIVREIALSDQRIRLVSRENRGLVATLNEGIALAEGDYIARMDADDIARPDRFAAQAAFLDRNPGHVVVGGQIMLIDPEGRELYSLPQPTTHEDIDACNLEGKTGICHPTALIRKSALVSIGGYDADYPSAQDIDLWLRLAETGKLANLQEIVLSYRLHFDSVGLSKRQAQRDLCWKAVRAAANRRGRTVPAREPQARVETRADTFAKWAWWALKGGNRQTARLYALKAFVRAPLKRSSWKLGLCALRGR